MGPRVGLGLVQNRSENCSKGSDGDGHTDMSVCRQTNGQTDTDGQTGGFVRQQTDTNRQAAVGVIRYACMSSAPQRLVKSEIDFNFMTSIM